MKAVVVMPVNTPPEPGTSTLASVHLAFYLARRFGAPIMRPNEPKTPPTQELDVPLLPVQRFARGRFDLAIWVAGSHSFCTDMYRDAMADVYRRTLINVYVVNDYHLPLLPKAARVAKATGNFYYRWTTVPHHLRRAGDSYVNLNQIAFRAQTPREPNAEHRRTLLYYGAFRQPRRDMFAKYFGAGIPYRAVISTGSGRTRFGNSVADLAAMAAGAELTRKFEDLLIEVQGFGASLYVEDEYSRSYYTSPAMRFYELVAAGVPILFDVSSRFTLTTAGFDIEPYIVDGPADVKRTIPRWRRFAADQLAAWRHPYREWLDAEVDAALARVLYHARLRGRRYQDAVDRIATDTTVVPADPPQELPRAQREEKEKSMPRKPPKSKPDDPSIALRNRQHALALEREFEIGFIKNFVTPSSTVLDVGCGRDADAALVLAEFPKRTPHAYIGIDSAAKPGWSFTWAKVYDVDPIEGLETFEAKTFSVVVARDLLDRVKPADHPRTLRLLANRVEPAGVLFVGIDRSYVPNALDRDARRAGLVVDDRFGVRAEIRELNEAVPPEYRKLIKKLSRYYCDQVVGAFLATVEPDAALRSIAVLRPEGAEALESPVPIQHSPNPTGTARKARRAPASAELVPQPKKGRKTPASKAKLPDPKQSELPLGDPPADAAAKTGRARPQGIGAFIRDELRRGTPDAEIIAKVRRKFPTSRTQQSDVNWNRRKLRTEEGLEV